MKIFDAIDAAAENEALAIRRSNTYRIRQKGRQSDNTVARPVHASIPAGKCANPAWDSRQIIVRWGRRLAR